MSSSIVFIEKSGTNVSVNDTGTTLPTANATSPEKFFLIGGASQGVYARMTDGTNFWYIQISN